MRIETKCVQAGYQPENGQPRILPIYQSTTYKYDSAEHLGKLFDLSVPGHMYTRISNPTVEMVEEKIAALEGGVGAMLTSSGQAANLLAVLNIASAGGQHRLFLGHLRRHHQPLCLHAQAPGHRNALFHPRGHR